MENGSAVKNKLSDNTPLWAASLCLFFSGAAALLYEILWFRQLALIFGISSYALSTILASFMAGLGIGGYLFGRCRFSRPKALCLYSIAEILIGIYGFCSPQLIGLFQSNYIRWYPASGGPASNQVLIVFWGAFLALIFPTFLMGATLPLIVSAVTTGSGGTVRAIGILYFANTLGGVAGAGVTGFFLVRHLGTQATLFVGIGLNLLAGAMGLILWWNIRNSPAFHRAGDSQAPSPRRPGVQALLPLIAVFLSGGASMIYEVVWTRLASLMVGSSTYAFTTILLAFLLGIASGSLFLARPAERSGRPALLLAAIQGLLALFVWASCPFLDRAHLIILNAYLRFGGNFGAILAAEFLIAMAVIFVPTFFLGATFPLANRLYLGQAGNASRSVGNLYASNTLGAILGALAGGFVLLGHPEIGAQKALIIGGSLNLLVACLAVTMACPSRTALLQVTWVGASLVSLVVYFNLPEWHKLLLVSGVFDHPRHYERQLKGAKETKSSDTRSLRKIVEREMLLYYAEGPDATVSISSFTTSKGELRKYLRINGKVEATSALVHDLPTQVLVSQIGLCLHPLPRRVALIGLGSGISLGSILSHPEVETVHCLELSPLVVNAARFFAKENENAMDDPRVRIIVNDARNHLMATRDSYDVIVSEPSNPWITGVSNLFTMEHYMSCKDRLSPGGLMCQWFHLYGTTPDLLRVILRTFLEVFPHTTLWVAQNDIFMVGSIQPWQQDRQSVAKHLQIETVQRNLATIKMANAEAFFKKFLLSGEELRHYVGPGPINTDDRPIIEFAAPWAVYESLEKEILQEIKSFQKGPPANP